MISNDDIEDIDIIKSKDTLFIYLKLKDKHPVCPYCGFDAKIKDPCKNTKIKEKSN